MVNALLNRGVHDKTKDRKCKEETRMRSFYHYMMRYRGNRINNEEKQLADWMFEDHSFPKQAKSYDEISRYLEWNAPFPSSLAVFDRLYELYEVEEE